MKYFLTLVLWFCAQTVMAQTISPVGGPAPKTKLEVKYAKLVRKDFEQVAEMKEQLATDKTVVCPKMKGTFLSDCIIDYVDHHKLTSPEQVMLLAAVIADAVLKDTEADGGKSYKLVLSDHLVQLLNQIQLSSFHLNSPEFAGSDKAELNKLKRRDEALMTSTFSRLIKSIEEDVIDLEEEKSKATPENAALIKELRKKIDFYKFRVWSYSK